ncbi:hypothetical protein GWI33_005490 [Rhynchophorus ferrugineus]|uniref:Uncharacterized protein n=1 Tax=Rhynchophorus ferrugineus TaxID=354439 RepID=A0A834IGN4_RHYFE|nr:hypothetical protein GWI33_005490 [Rhynchophorus ferrugineus]
MRTLVVLLMVTVMSEWCRAGELLEVNENTKANIGKLLNAGTKPNVHFADQIDGFNSSTLKSGPIVLQDKRTIFISDLQYKGKEQTLSYWAGTSNPNGKKTLISKQPFEGNHSNVDLSMSSLTITLDNVTFIGVGEEDHLLAYVMLVNATGVNISLIREDRKSVSDIPVYTVPKCCPQKQLIYPETGCGEVPQSVDWNVTIFESNVTGLDPDIILDGSQYELNLYHYKPKCDDGQLVAMSHNEIYGLIYNSSLIIKGEGIKAHHQFCVDTSFDSSKRLYETITIVCYSVNEQVSNLYIYLPG